MTVPKIIAIFLVLLIVNFAAMLTGLALPAGRGRARVRHRRLSRLVHHPGRDRRAADRRAGGRSSRCSAPTNMSAGASCSSGSSARSSSTTWAIRTRSTPTAARPASRSATSSAPAASGSGARVLQLYWALFAVILLVVAASAVAARHRPWACACGSPVRRRPRAAPLAIAGVAALAMAGDRRLRLSQHQGRSTAIATVRRRREAYGADYREEISQIRESAAAGGHQGRRSTRSCSRRSGG